MANFNLTDDDYDAILVYQNHELPSSRPTSREGVPNVKNKSPTPLPGRVIARSSPDEPLQTTGPIYDEPLDSVPSHESFCAASTRGGTASSIKRGDNIDLISEPDEVRITSYQSRYYRNIDLVIPNDSDDDVKFAVPVTGTFPKPSRRFHQTCNLVFNEPCSSKSARSLSPSDCEYQPEVHFNPPARPRGGECDY